MSYTIKGFFFDLDGTLVDTIDANYHAYKEAILQVCAVEISMEQYKDTHGMVYKDFLPIFVPKISKDDIEKVSLLKKEAYARQMHLTKPNAFLIDFLRRMAEDYVTVLVTTAKRANAERVLVEHEIDTCFNYMVFGDDVKKMKPNPEAYINALKMTGLGEDEVIAFEDSQVGIKAANNAGIATIHIRSFL